MRSFPERPLALINGEVKPLADMPMEGIAKSERDQKLARITMFGADLGIPTAQELKALDAVHEIAIEENKSRQELGATGVRAA